jgi:hypothetical protein
MMDDLSISARYTCLFFSSRTTIAWVPSAIRAVAEQAFRQSH